MANTTILQGNFTSTGSPYVVQLESGVDWMRVYNYTVASNAQTTAVGVEYYWQNGFPAGYGWEYKKSNAAAAANLSAIITSNGFTYVDSSVNNLGGLNATITAISTATPPVVTNTGTNGLLPGNVVRLFNVAGAQQLGGYDFTVGYGTLSATTFSLDYMVPIAVATTGSWRVVNNDPMFYPPHRFITSITSSGSSSVVVTSVTHKYQVGQAVRFTVPAAFGMTQMDTLLGNITAVNTSTTVNSFTVDIDSSAFTAFTFPLSAATPFSPALVVPVGMDTSLALADSVNILSDATYNTAYTGMILGAGANGPAGQNNDVVYWVAGKSFSNNGN